MIRSWPTPTFACTCVSVVNLPMFDRSTRRSPTPSSYADLQPAALAGDSTRVPTPSPRLTSNHAKATLTAATTATMSATVSPTSDRTRMRERRLPRVASDVHRIASPAEDEHPAEAGSRPDRGTREKDCQRNGGEAESNNRPRPFASSGKNPFRDRLLLAFVRDDEHCGEVDQNPGSSKQREDHESQPEERRIQVEVAPEAAGHARNHAVGRAALETLDAFPMCDVFAHACRVPRPELRVNRDFPWSDPRGRHSQSEGDRSGPTWAVAALQASPESVSVGVWL